MEDYIEKAIMVIAAVSVGGAIIAAAHHFIPVAFKLLEFYLRIKL